MNNSNVVRQRLHNQKLSSSELKKPADVVRWLGAVQAQEFESAKWALALRMRNATKAIIEKAYNDGKILRTHVMRPTWHFVAAEDIRWLIQLSAPQLKSTSRATFRSFGLDAETCNRANALIVKTLEGGKHLTRAEIMSELKNKGIDSD